MSGAFHSEWRMMVHRASGRIVSCAPTGDFRPPARIVIVDTAGTHHFSDADCEPRDWANALPRGFTPQTSFLFRFEADRIVEISQALCDDAVVL